MPCDMPRDRLWSWVHGDEEPAQAAEIAGHVRDCPTCAPAVAQMQALVSDIAAAPTSDAASRRWPESIGPYRIVRLLGEGGMGVVFEAEQQAPRRSVALKVIRAAQWADDYRVRLFQRETLSLARLSHPGIAAIYDAGCTDDGQHYFAMELVRGVPLLDYADGFEEPGALRPPLSTRERLALFHRICEAINYAHQRGVVHRDIKPTNILVDAAGTPKVLDFGLARFTEPDVAGGATMATELGRVIGTLAYMSPEQVCGLTDQIDVRTDVYALGMVLYELLTDRLPYEVGNAPLHETVRTICLEPPADPRRIVPSLPADVATITLKAIEKEAVRRYQTAAELADDVQRFLTDHPIVARRPSALYRLRKFVRRNRVPVALLSLLFVVTSGATVRLKIQADRLEHERNAARAEAGKFRELSAVMTEFLSSADPWTSGSGSRDTKVIDVLDETARRIVREVSNPLIAAALRHTLGNTYRRFAEFDQAEQHLAYAWETRRKLLGETHAESVASLNDLGEMFFEKGDVPRAEPLLRQSLELRMQTLSPPDAELAESLNSYGLVLKSLGELDAAQRHMEQALQMQLKLAARLEARAGAQQGTKELRDAHDAEARTRNNLAALHRARAARLRETGDTAGARGELDRARELYQQAMELRQRWLGPDHPDVAKMHNNYAVFLRDIGELDAAAEHAGEALRILTQELGEQHVLTARALYNLARLERDRGHRDRATALCLRALEIQGKLLGAEHVQTAQTRELLEHVASSQP